MMIAKNNKLIEFSLRLLGTILIVVITTFIQKINFDRTDIRITVYPPEPFTNGTKDDPDMVECKDPTIKHPLLIKFEIANKSRNSIKDKTIQLEFNGDSLAIFCFSKSDKMYSNIDSSKLLEKKTKIFHYQIDELIRGKNHVVNFVCNRPIIASEIDIGENLKDHKVKVHDYSSWDVNKKISIIIMVLVSVGVIFFLLILPFIKQSRKGEFDNLKKAIENFDN